MSQMDPRNQLVVDELMLLFQTKNSELDLVTAKGLSLIENSDIDTGSLNSIGAQSPNSYVVGITGPTGVGKSSLLAALIERLDLTKIRVAVLAIDPSSELTGGALLGDRVRIDSRSDASSLFYFRSVASRGSLNGIPPQVSPMVAYLKILKYQLIFIETLGAGQNSTQINDHVDFLINVTSTNIGDEVQLAKSGLMEYGNLFFVNKQDLGGAEYIQSILDQKFKLFVDSNKVRPIVIVGSTKSGSGILQICNIVLEWCGL